MMASNARPFTLSIRVDGIRECLAAFNRLPTQASAELRTASLRVSKDLATQIQAAGMSQGRQARLVAGTVKARRDRAPNVVIGYPLTRKIGHPWPGGRGTSGDLIMGSEFGAHSGHGFLPHNGKRGSWIFPTVEREAPAMAAAWLRAADSILYDFTRGT